MEFPGAPCHGRLVIQERNYTDVPTVSYTRGTDLSGTLQGAGGIGGLLARSYGYSSGNWSAHHAYHADGGGNITAMVNTLQALNANYRYDSFGNLIGQSGSISGANTYRFSSKEWIPSADLYYYGYRFYSPNYQRWINQDPIGEKGGINLFGFVRNRPTGAVDASGLTPCSDFVDSLVDDFQQHDNPNALGEDWLNKRQTTLPDATGFRPDLIAGGQGGAVSRHIYGHAGAVLRYNSGIGVSPIGNAASLWEQGREYLQRFREGRSAAESQAEIAGDRAGRAVADLVRDHYDHPMAPCTAGRDCADADALRRELRDLLCE